MLFNDKGLALLKSFEGCKLEAYRDIKGILTIGYGHTGPDVHEGMEINQPYADILLKKDLAWTIKCLQDAIHPQLTDNQFSACVCLAYNIGVGNFQSSTLLKLINANEIENAASEFVKWDHAGGIVVAGLLRRREAERDLFIS